MTRFVPQRRWIVVELVFVELSISGVMAAIVWKSNPASDGLFVALGWIAYAFLLVAVCWWTLRSCFGHIEIGQGFLRRNDGLALRDTAVPLSALTGVSIGRGWTRSRAVRVTWPSGSIVISIAAWTRGIPWTAWTWRDARAIVACLQEHGVPVSPDVLLELNLALPPPNMTEEITRYWPTGYSGGGIGNIIRMALLLAPAAALIYLNRGVPIERWEAKAFWLVWLLVGLFWLSDKFEYVDIGSGYFRRVGLLGLSRTSVPLRSITSVTTRSGWLGIPRVTVEWQQGRLQFAPIHFDPRLSLSRWTPFGIRQVVQRLRQERVAISDDALDELGLADASRKSARP